MLNKVEHPKGRLLRRKNFTAWCFLLPSIVGVATFVLIPYLETIRRSFVNTLGTGWVGMQNYQSVLQNDAFRLAAYNTAHFICICLPLLLMLSLLLALVLHLRPLRESRIGSAFKTTFLLPMAIPVASIVLLWKALFARNGLFNSVLYILGAKTVDFMGSSAAFWVLISTYLWKNTGYDSILWITGLDAIPAEQYEAAQVDGANRWQQFRYITAPGLIPTLILTTILSLLNTFKVFREAYLVAGAYPQESIYLLQHLFNNWFLNLDLPRLTSAAILVSLVLVAAILLLIYFWDRYDSSN